MISKSHSKQLENVSQPDLQSAGEGFKRNYRKMLAS